MDVTKLPFNQLVGLRAAEEGTSTLLELPSNANLLNHIGTVHASAIYALAEASSGQYLAQLLSARENEILPVLRRGEVKYRKPGTGKLVSQGELADEDLQRFLDELDRRRRALVSFRIRILDAASVEVAVGHYEWFVTIRDQRQESK